MHAFTRAVITPFLKAAGISTTALASVYFYAHESETATVGTLFAGCLSRAAPVPGTLTLLLTRH